MGQAPAGNSSDWIRGLAPTRQAVDHPQTPGEVEIRTARDLPLRKPRATGAVMVTVWWIAKVAFGLLLVGHLVAVAANLYALPTYPLVPVIAARILVVVGALLSLWHYLLLRSAAGDLSQPSRLVHDRGLFKVIRHPMYLGDTLLYTGLAMLAADGVGFVLASLGIAGIVGQAVVEDRAMRMRFGDEFDAWKRRTGLLVPRIS